MAFLSSLVGLVCTSAPWVMMPAPFVVVGAIFSCLLIWWSLMVSLCHQAAAASVAAKFSKVAALRVLRLSSPSRRAAYYEPQT